MDRDYIISQAEILAKEKMKDYDPGHDWWHILRVRKIANIINDEEKTADPFLLDVSAILHDAADSKFSNSGKYSDLDKFLQNKGVPCDTSLRIISAIKNISFSNKNPSGDLKDPLFLILQDADRLDAIGATGIARAFSYGSSIKNPIYVPPDKNGIIATSTIRHFYDKLLKLKDLMNTSTGKRLAEDRHEFLEKFLQQFYSEWKI